MRSHVRALGAVLILTAVLALPGIAAAAEDPIIRMDSRTELEIDLGMVVDDFLPLLLGAAQAEDPEEAAKLEAVSALLGLNALDRLFLKSVTDDEQTVSEVAITLDPAKAEGLLAATFAVPPGRFGFAKYIREDVPVVMSLPNFAGGLAALIDFMKRPEMAEMLGGSGIAVAEDGMLSIMGIKPEERLLPLLSGELDMLLLSPPTHEEPDFEELAVLVLGTRDGPAFQAYLFELLEQFMGAEAAAEFALVPGRTAGDFTIYPLKDAIFYAVSPDYFVLTSDPDWLERAATGSGPGLPEIKGRHYLRADGDMVMRTLAGIGDQWDRSSGGEEVKAEFLSDLAGIPMGTVEFHSTSTPTRWTLTATEPRALWTAQYRMLKLLLAAVPKMEAVEKKQGRLRAAIGELDAAFTSYGIDHGGLYPETIDALVTEGYLEALPDLQPTGLGVYLEGGYTYVPLLNDDGYVAGYYCFIYGAGPDTGYDVFTPENLDAEDFHIDRDGIRDGVVGFCYDGLAQGQVETYNDN